jgi:amidase
MSEPNQIGAVDARRLIGERRLSPVELLDACIGRIEATDPPLNAIVSTCFERARTEARAAEKAVADGDDLPPLHGLPIGIKDLSVTEGLRTTFGSPLYADWVPEADEQIVATLRRAGAIVVGKTNTTEFGAGSNTTNDVFGPTRNPFDTDRTCGGSSGGSAVALATDMLPLCTGSDTGGSLRLPATWSGIVSLRPTPGLVPFERRVHALTPFQILGPMGRDVADTALLLSVMAEENGLDPMAYPRDAASFAEVPEVDLGDLRVAVSDDLGFAPTGRVIRATFGDRIDAFASVFGRVEETHPDLSTAARVNWILRAVLFLANHKERYDAHRDKLGHTVIVNCEAALRIPIEDVAWAQREQMRLHQRVHAFFQDHDLLICPGATIPPFPVEQLYPTEVDGKELETYVEWAGLTNVVSVLGCPVVALPCGSDPTGTPFGFQLIGPPRSERFVLGVAAALERVFAGRPDLARPIPVNPTDPAPRG